MEEKMERKQPSRLYYLDYLRIISTFTVIVLHVASYMWRSIPVTSTNWQILNVYDSVVRWCVPIFVMISGALFLDNNKKIETKDLYSKYILRIVTAFFFWSVAYAIQNAITKKTFDGFFYSVLGGYYHMWYLFMIIGLYMITPLLRKITESKKLTEYFIILGLIFTFAIPRLLDLPAVLGWTELDQLVSVLKANKISMNFNFTLGYTAYYVLGYYISKYPLKGIFKGLIYIGGPICFALIISMTKWYSVRMNKAQVFFYENISINVLITSLFVFLLVKNCCTEKPPKGKQLKRLLNLSKYSFGIYLVHYIIITVIYYIFHFTAVTINPIIGVPLLSIIVFIVSLLISFILNKIPFVNKYFV